MFSGDLTLTAVGVDIENITMEDNVELRTRTLDQFLNGREKGVGYQNIAHVYRLRYITLY